MLCVVVVVVFVRRSLSLAPISSLLDKSRNKRTESKCRMLAEEKLNEIGAEIYRSSRKFLRRLSHETDVSSVLSF
jgi:hypothetical protein